MRRYTRRRPRYPQKKSRLRPFLLLILPGLLILLLIGSALILGEDDSPHIKSESALPRLIELAPEEAYPQGALPPDLLFDRLLLEKSRRRLTAFAQGEPVRVYLVALGENPVGPKQEQGDKRTPEGLYRISAKSPDRHFYKRLAISYPNEDDQKRAEARGVDPGGDISIHGLAPEYAHIGQAHRVTDWTYGSIALTNEEMDQLYGCTAVETPIELVP